MNKTTRRNKRIKAMDKIAYDSRYEKFFRAALAGVRKMRKEQAK